MVYSFKAQDPVSLVTVENFSFNTNSDLLKQVTVKEINMAESLLTPGLQTSVTLQSYLYTNPSKNFEELKNSELDFRLSLTRGSEEYGDVLARSIAVKQIIYRMENREIFPTNVSQTEEFTIHACDPSLLLDAKKLVSKSWKCTKPSEIVKGVLENCVGIKSDFMEVDEAEPARDYIAENIHPFQVISQQSNVGLYKNDPSFLHYMTYDKYGSESLQPNPMHYFRSVKKLCESDFVKLFKFGETGYPGYPNAKGGYQHKNVAISVKFPCDFDFLVDVLNGLDENGNDNNTLTTFNPSQKSFSQLGNQDKDCGIGGYNHKVAMTNQGSAKEQNSCNLDVETHLLKRQARMSLLDRDKIAMRIVVPWDPGLHVGSVIRFTWRNKYAGDTIYGSGDYLILHLNHTIRLGGFAVTTMDCVSKNVGEGKT